MMFLKDTKNPFIKKVVDNVLFEVQKLRNKEIDIYGISLGSYFQLILWINKNYLLVTLNDYERLYNVMESCNYPYQLLAVGISPAEKAKELYQKFFISTPQPYTIYNIERNGKELMFDEWDKQWTVNMAKSQAIICIDEIMNYVTNNEIEFWNEVKMEINKK